MNWFGPLFFLGVLLVLLVSLWNGRAPRPASEPGSVAIVETAETFSIANPLPTLPPPPTPEPLETAPDFLLTDLFDETYLLNIPGRVDKFS